MVVNQAFLYSPLGSGYAGGRTVSSPALSSWVSLTTYVSGYAPAGLVAVPPNFAIEHRFAAVLPAAVNVKVATAGSPPMLTSYITTPSGFSTWNDAGQFPRAWGSFTVNVSPALAEPGVQKFSVVATGSFQPAVTSWRSTATARSVTGICAAWALGAASGDTTSPSASRKPSSRLNLDLLSSTAQLLSTSIPPAGRYR